MLDRVCPALKPQAQPINLPSESVSLVKQGNSIINTPLNGQIPTGVAAQLVTGLSNQGGLIELEQLNKRLIISKYPPFFGISAESLKVPTSKK